MPKSLNARMDESAQDRAENEALLLEIQKERADVAGSYRKLAALGREEAQLRERHIEGLKHERTAFFSKRLWLMLGAGFFGSMFHESTVALIRWLGATLAAWWSS